MPDGKTLSFSIPAGATDGQTVKLTGQGRKVKGAKPGDARITLKIARHRRYSIDGADLRVSESIPLAMAVNGGKLAVETFDGKLSLSIPPWTDGGRIFRLKGKGLPKKGGGHGDLLLTVNIELPKEGRDQLADLLRKPDLRSA
jgi:DnaJ-class molecular chaperone